jgi:DNA-binding NarL/FixJ family response regulator
MYNDGELGMRVLLADDHALVRAGIRALLVGLPDVESVVEAGDGQELAARVAREAPETRLVILSMHGTPAHVAQALRVGVSGYLLKDAAADELPVLLRAVMRGETYLSPAISKQVVDGYLGRTAPASNGNGAAADVLTSRQREILQLVAEGKSTKEVAQLLDVSAKTVETHRGQIMERLGIHDLAGLVRYAIRTGLVSPDR